MAGKDATKTSYKEEIASSMPKTKGKGMPPQFAKGGKKKSKTKKKMPPKKGAAPPNPAQKQAFMEMLTSAKGK